VIPLRPRDGASDWASLDDLPTIAFTAGADGEIQFVSKHFYRQTGVPAQANLASAWARTLHPEDRENVANRWRTAVASGQPYEDELRLQSADGTYRWYLSRALPMHDPVSGRLTGYAGTAFDIDAQKKAESDLRELIFLHESVSARERLYAWFAEKLSGALSLDDTVDVMLGAIVPAFADWMSVYVENRDGSGFHVVAMRHWDVARKAVVDQLIGTTFATESSATAQVLRTGKSMLLERYPADLRARSIRPEFDDHLRLLGLRSAIVVPFKHREKVIGAIHVIRGDNPNDFGPDDLLLIEELARRMTPAIHNAETYERERLVARRFQEAALPANLPQMSWLTFDAVYEAAESDAQVGGDWYDAFVLDDGRVVLTIGDVAGHGLDAAVTMSSVRQSLRAAAVIDAEPLAMLRVADSIVRGLGTELFVTAFVGIVDPGTLEFSFAGAGHPPPMLRRADGVVEALDGGGVPLGIYDGADRQISVAQLEAGCVLVLYTDGLTEFDRDPIDGERRLAESLRVAGDAQTAHAVYFAIAGRRACRDDVAILTVRFDRAPGDRFEAVQWNFDALDWSTAEVVRAEVAATLVARGCSTDEVALAELVLSELLGNVVRHTHGRVQVLLDLATREPTLHVVDEGPSFEAHVESAPDVWCENGRGLFIVNALAGELVIAPRDTGGNHVRVALWSQ